MAEQTRSGTLETPEFAANSFHFDPFSTARIVPPEAFSRPEPWYARAEAVPALGLQCSPLARL